MATDPLSGLTRNWVLPEYVEDVLPAEAARVERLRRLLLDHFVVHGYELVMPPMIEYTESLLTGTGHDLDLRTFKLVDQLTGRMLGVRADITPQVARIDAHLLNRAGVTRLAYCGTVLHALPPPMSSSRELLQIGAELFGHAGVEGDIEIQRLKAMRHDHGLIEVSVDALVQTRKLRDDESPSTVLSLPVEHARTLLLLLRQQLAELDKLQPRSRRSGRA